MSTYCLTVVSVERQIFFGMIKKMQIMGDLGEMGIFAGHVPLLTCIKPGVLHFVKECGASEYIYLSGGILEIQKNFVTILADTAIRADELDVEQAKNAKSQVEKHLHRLRYDDKDYMKISLEMSKVVAKIRLLKFLKK